MSNFSVNSGFLYAVTAVVIVYVLAQSGFFLVRAAKRAKQVGISGAVVRKTILSSALFTVAPAVAILLGVVTLSKFLGLPLPWLRLSVLGALTYVALYMAKTFIFGQLVDGMTLDAVTVKMLSKLPGSCMNAVFAAVVAPILFNALRPALKHAGLFEKL